MLVNVINNSTVAQTLSILDDTGKEMEVYIGPGSMLRVEQETILLNNSEMVSRNLTIYNPNSAVTPNKPVQTSTKNSYKNSQQQLTDTVTDNNTVQ